MLKPKTDSIHVQRGFLTSPVNAATPATGPGSLEIPGTLIKLPADQYMHPGAPTEWWWHTGTLTTKEGGRKFGFEINAAQIRGLAFTEVMLTDVASQKHFHKTTVVPFDKATWAESNPSLPWRVKLGDVSMWAPQSDPIRNMSVKAQLSEGGVSVIFDLELSQEESQGYIPFSVWGIGVSPPPPPDPTLKNNNFYYSLTRLRALGLITIGNQVFEVDGVTWMDHEWGKFGTAAHPVKWILQDMQLDNGWCLSNYSVDPPSLNQPIASRVTLQRPDGSMFFANSHVTPTEPWTNAAGYVYYLQLNVEIPDFGANLVVKSLMNSQEFTGVYEGVASVKGSFLGEQVSGTAWNEQALGYD